MDNVNEGGQRGHPSSLVRQFRMIVAKLVEEGGYTHKSVAKRAGISVAGWYQWWNKPERGISVERMERVIAALGYELQWKLLHVELPEETEKELRGK